MKRVNIYVYICLRLQKYISSNLQELYESCAYAAIRRQLWHNKELYMKDFPFYSLRSRYECLNNTPELLFNLIYHYFIPEDF